MTDEERLALALEVLARLESVGDEGEGGYCPVCFCASWKPHADDCDLAVVLRGTHV